MLCSYGDINKNVDTRLLKPKSPLSILDTEVSFLVIFAHTALEHIGTLSGILISKEGVL